MNGSTKAEDTDSCHGQKAELLQIGRPGRGANGFISRSDEGETSRRDFLSLMGFGVAAAGVTGCRAPVQHAMPLPIGSDTIVPGVPAFYATTCGGCGSSCTLLVRQRDGRPIKIEGNPDSPLFGRGTCATGQATVLSLYDDARLRAPLWHGQAATWPEVDRSIGEALAAAREDKRNVVLLSSTITSPVLRETIAEWSRRIPTFKHVVYDAVSASAIRAASVQAFGAPLVPHYAFDKARVIVALDADFLGTWLSPVEFARQYAAGRKVDGAPSFHVQIESGLSITGTNADLRVPVAPSEIGAVAVAIAARVARKAGVAAPAPIQPEPADGKKLDEIAARLWAAKGASLVVSGSQDPAVQMVVTGMNAMLGNIGHTLDVIRPSLQAQGDDAAMAALVADMNAGKIHTLLLYGVNPAYDYADAAGFAAGMQKVALSVSFADRADETAQLATAVCPDHNFLESWGDAEPVTGHISLMQPVVRPLFDTRAAGESLRRWLSSDETEQYAYLRAFWQREMFTRQQAALTFDAFWDHSLQNGFVDLPLPVVAPVPAPPPVFHGDWRAAARAIAQDARKPKAPLELHLDESIALRDGRHANNPWLQELPDPLTKLTWGNVARVSPKTAEKMDLHSGDVVTLKTGAGQITLPVFVQPGQEARTISVALGYGRSKVGKAGDGVGENAFALTALVGGSRRFDADLTLEKTGRREALASAQPELDMHQRPIVLTTTLEKLKHDAEEPAEELADLWSERLSGEYSWGMAIDINACTGCSACVVACQAENNVPVVGKDQVQRLRIMHWLRIDRYYDGADENPVSLHQPMMCQHCAHAPCETVCPVLATTTSSEGLNQQVYNRCIGTRYCANNCPYKVRRFNWYNYSESDDFQYTMTSPVGRLVLNPDVAVRTRGIMEKCSLCVQRIQLGKNTALKEGREMADGDVQTACAQSCPTQAITFGDLKDPKSRVSLQMHGPRAYKVLEDLGTKPNVGYLKKLRRSEET